MSTGNFNAEKEAIGVVSEKEEEVVNIEEDSVLTKQQAQIRIYLWFIQNLLLY